MEEKIINIISLIINLSQEQLKKNIDTTDLWNSLKKVEIIIALEEEFDIVFSPKEIAEIKTVSHILNLVKNKK